MWFVWTDLILVLTPLYEYFCLMWSDNPSSRCLSCQVANLDTCYCKKQGNKETTKQGGNTRYAICNKTDFMNCTVTSRPSKNQPVYIYIYIYNVDSSMCKNIMKVKFWSLQWTVMLLEKTSYWPFNSFHSMFLFFNKLFASKICTLIVLSVFSSMNVVNFCSHHPH